VPVVNATKRAKLRGLKRNANVVLGNVGTLEDADVLTGALGDDEPLMREHATWALARLTERTRASSTAGRQTPRLGWPGRE
jgi:epoxyqueuosine reductase